MAAGVTPDSMLRVKGQGEAGRYGGVPGDLLIKMQVYGKGGFRRRGMHLYSDVAVGILDAVLGTTVAVPTVRGQHQVEVPPGVNRCAYIILKHF